MLGAKKACGRGWLWDISISGSQASSTGLRDGTTSNNSAKHHRPAASRSTPSRNSQGTCPLSSDSSILASVGRHENYDYFNDGPRGPQANTPTCADISLLVLHLFIKCIPPVPGRLAKHICLCILNKPRSSLLNLSYGHILMFVAVFFRFLLSAVDKPRITQSLVREGRCSL